jgi:two-component system cell cycle sensor histidine kinase PleC
VQVHQDPDGATSITVKDSGVGIAPEDVQNVLLPFVQSENPFSADQPGTGLGLPLARSFIEAHGGSLTLASQLGEGTTVTLRLPPACLPAALEQSA